MLAQLHRGEEIYIFNRIYIMLIKIYINHIVGADSISALCLQINIFLDIKYEGRTVLYHTGSPLRQFRNISKLFQGVCI